MRSTGLQTHTRLPCDDLAPAKDEPMLQTNLASPAETSLAYRGWRVVLVCFVMATFCWGFGFYGQSVFLADLSRLKGWPASLVSAAITAYYLVSAVLVAFVSDIMGRIGPKLMVLGGTACLAVATASLPLVAAPWQLFGAFLIMAFGWAAMSLGAISNILGLWFNHRRGLAISLALNGASCGGILVAPILAVLVSAVGFANAVWIAVAAMIAVVTPLALLWIDRPDSRGAPHASGQGAAIATKTGNHGSWTKAGALRSAHFWGITATFALALVVQVGFLVHQVSFLEPMLGHNLAGAVVGLSAIMALIGRLAMGAVVDRLDRASRWARSSTAWISVSRLRCRSRARPPPSSR
jgi:MFS family permease